MNLFDLRIKNLDEFKVEILGQLGGYFNEIELVDANWLSIIRKTYNYFKSYDSGACVNRSFVKLKLNNKLLEYNLENFNISRVIRVIGSDSILQSQFHQQLLLNGIYGTGSWMTFGSNGVTSDMTNGMNDYIMNYSNIRTVEKFFTKKIVTRFNKNNGILTLNNRITTPDLNVMLDCFVMDSLIDMFNNDLFQALALAYTKIQWAKNLEGKVKIEFPHGELVIADVLAEGKEESEKYEKEIKNFKNRSLAYKS